MNNPGSVFYWGELPAMDHVMNNLGSVFYWGELIAMDHVMNNLGSVLGRGGTHRDSCHGQSG